MEQHYCRIHNTKFYFNEKNGKTWYSHKKADGSGYCNENSEYSSVPPVNPGVSQDTRSARIERQHSQEMAIRYYELMKMGNPDMDVLFSDIQEMTDKFQRDLDDLLDKP